MYNSRNVSSNDMDRLSLLQTLYYIASIIIVFFYLFILNIDILNKQLVLALQILNEQINNLKEDIKSKHHQLCKIKFFLIVLILNYISKSWSHPSYPLLKHLDEQRADDLPLGLWFDHPFKCIQKAVSGVHHC